MKHIILTLIAIVTATFTLTAKEVAKNPATGMTLSENLGVYTITGKSGAIILGDKKMAGEFLLNASKAFAQETLHDIFSVGKDKFEVGKDDQGFYLIKVGLGACKVRPTDVMVFGPALGVKVLSQKVKGAIDGFKNN